MPWSRWIEHDGDGAAHDRLIGVFIDVVKADGSRSQSKVTPPEWHVSGYYSAFVWGACRKNGDPGFRHVRYRVWSDELPSFDVTRIDADRPMELAEWE